MEGIVLPGVDHVCNNSALLVTGVVLIAVHLLVLHPPKVPVYFLAKSQRKEREIGLGVYHRKVRFMRKSSTRWGRGGPVPFHGSFDSQEDQENKKYAVLFSGRLHNFIL